MNGRVYDPATGMFMSPDPFIQSPGDWVNYNRYSYCMGNPMKYTDPSGYAWDGKGADGMTNEQWTTYWYQKFLAEQGTMEALAMGRFVEQMNQDHQDMANYANQHMLNDPNSNDVSAHFGEAAMEKLQDGYNLYSFTFSSGYTSYAASIGDIGQATVDSNGGLSFSNSTAGMISPGMWGVGNSWAATATDWLNNVAGGLGTGMGKLSGTFRLTDGAYNGSDLSIKYYSSGWNGGSRAGIATYNAAEWGSKIGKASILVSVGLGAYNIYNGIQKDGGTYGLNAQVATGQTIGGIGGCMAGAEIGAAIGVWFGGVGAIPGAIIGGAIGGWVGSETGKATVLEIRQ